MGLKLLVTSFVVSCTLIVLGVIAIAISGSLVNKMVTGNANLAPGGELYKQWVDPPIDVYISFYLFDLKNPTDFENGVKPIFDEVGPFVYKEYVYKDNIIVNANGSLSYKDRREYFFMSNMSVHDQSYKITSMNMAAVTVINGIKYQNFAIAEIVNLALRGVGETLLITKTVREIMFGYEDQFLADLKIIAPSLVPSEKVGLFIGKNNTVDGSFTVNTGEADYKKVGYVENYNFESKLNIWATKEANMINGSDGTVLHPLITKDEKIYIFENELCRSLYAVYNNTIHLSDHNIELYGFSPDEYFYGNYTVNPDNAGFCSPADTCLPAGLLNLTSCQQGIPIIMSCPHFLFGAESLWQDVGLKPDYKLHGTQIYVEPTSGLLMKANKRIQFNTMIERDTRIKISAKLPEVLYPLFWVDEHFTIDEKNADKYYNEVALPLKIVNILKWVIFGIGILLFVFTLLYGYCLRNRINDYLKGKKNLNINQAESQENSIITDMIPEEEEEDDKQTKIKEEDIENKIENVNPVDDNV